MAKVFLLPEGDEKALKGVHIVNNRYRFVDGEMEVSDDIAEKIKPILCNFYGCTVEDVADEPADETKSGEPSLAVAVTKQ